ncbi:unnamed protein product [Ceutorhynchus assimilis]|uniref:Triacylglycerol lipase n=1 Tax=Ceutorhynchus assimilis TaxID=467358 RepID=A0A9N9N2F7_9CUCU|nr:unnamed protein product [Ceutorhynchus assimilis]
MANRGSTYSMGHEYLSSDSVEYWDFSFHEIGIYDISANMDMITKLTGHVKMHIITHSQGSTSLLALLCVLPEYQDKIISGNLLAPIVFLEHATLILIPLLKQFVSEIWFLGKALQLNRGVFTYNPLYTEIGVLLCHETSPIIELCINAFGICGNNPTQLNASMITRILSNSPAGGSFKSLIHYLQLAKANCFQHFDYGLRNLHIYGQFHPPAYNLSSIKTHLLIWFGRNDCLAGAKVSLFILNLLLLFDFLL